MSSLAQVSVVIPAAGKGVRMSAEISKQYLPLAGKPLLARTLSRVLALSPRQVVLVVAPGDEHWRAVEGVEHCLVVRGGACRAASVLNGLAALQAATNDWVLVHDGARPCVRGADIRRLFQLVATTEVGGLLGVPVTDTVKEVAAGLITASLDRTRLWLAQTPQIFRFGLLQAALQDALRQQMLITDEASAIEMMGFQPLMVEGHRDNIKVTHAEDLALAEYYLAQQAMTERGAV
ncbi:MAG: 2-C-methyl-D-erythritol 4-phosphate cytidylyltransferase [SAR86 cluster bacterium]|jgi:2-C-methyl-D-erythritol 4-phosphate cytidylyltransferase|uniref:2-C-methyl-D-erythritol 4-phosphate cytidylyltransferase n=1 Tax=SAR86 cluster bacterium TaxID=2030880 RepID=A0A973A9F8_9GAMM|nr:2-C-methyl-D-erythritol 4-phosphate cytidylyltransferase [SAR86 cluster bacterium]|tara:strand:+ start:15782 stop:16486 length:705 start_codon:yes stop_codon:yes gene_type:complete